MKIRDLMVFTTNRCNLNCDYCFVNSNSCQKELTVDEIKEAINIIKPTRVIHLTGGEPFLRFDDIVELANYAWTKVPVIVVNTNGTIHDIDLTKLIPPEGRQCNLIVSLDGFKENHDARCGTEGTFEKVLDFSRRALDLGLNVQVKATLSNDLINDEKYCEDFVRFCDAFGFTRVMMGNVYHAGRGEKYRTKEVCQMTKQEHLGLRQKIDNLNRVAEAKDFPWISKNDIYVLPQFCIQCNLDRGDASLEPDGTVKVECCFLDYPIGHYKDFTMEKFTDKLEEMKEMQRNGIDVRIKN